jgi:site-specific DNA-methyltransferase (adenine-specific)
LYYGDNLDILRQYIKADTIDLIYLDPPFKSNQEYNILFEERNGSGSKAQIKAFEDTWRWDQGSAEAYRDIVENGPERVSKVMQGFREFVGESDMLAYLSMMAPRLVELRRVLKPTGSIYLHCDPTASHYLKLLMDAVFGSKNFQNEIVWCYKTGGATKRRFARKHDILLFYAKEGTKTAFNPQKEKSYMMHKYGFKKSDFQEDEQGQYSWVIMKDWWEIPSVGSADRQRLGYPTQKPELLLERVITAGSNEGDVVLDSFCGCGTTIAVAQRLNRHWIGIDITHLAVNLVKHRLQNAFGEKIGQTYKVIGELTDLAGAKQLAEDDPFQFQCWALGLVGARPVEKKKGADKGIDGRLYFHDEPEGGKTKQILFSVKSGHTGPKDVRDLRGVIEREKAEIGVFICLQIPTKAMRTEAASAQFYKSQWRKEPYPRLQILTIEQLLNGKTIDSPPLGQVNVTFKKAPRAKNTETISQMHLSDEEERQENSKSSKKK